MIGKFIDKIIEMDTCEGETKQDVALKFACIFFISGLPAGLAISYISHAMGSLVALGSVVLALLFFLKT